MDGCFRLVAVVWFLHRGIYLCRHVYEEQYVYLPLADTDVDTHLNFDAFAHAARFADANPGCASDVDTGADNLPGLLILQRRDNKAPVPGTGAFVVGGRRTSVVQWSLLAPPLWQGGPAYCATRHIPRR